MPHAAFLLLNTYLTFCKKNSIVYLNCTFKSISYRVSSRRNSSINDLTRNSQISPKNNKLSLDSSVVFFGKRERDPIKDILILNSHFFTLDFLLQPDIHIHHVAVFVILLHIIFFLHKNSESDYVRPRISLSCVYLSIHPSLSCALCAYLQK